MADELLKLRGRLATNEQLITALETGIDVDIEEARCLLDKYVSKTELQMARVKIVVDRLDESVNRLKNLSGQTAAIKRDLGL